MKTVAIGSWIYGRIGSDNQHTEWCTATKYRLASLWLSWQNCQRSVALNGYGLTFELGVGGAKKWPE